MSNHIRLRVIRIQACAYTSMYVYVFERELDDLTFCESSYRLLIFYYFCVKFYHRVYYRFQFLNRTLREKYPNTEFFLVLIFLKSVQIRSFFWCLFSFIPSEQGYLRSKSPYSVRIQENTDQKKLSIWTLFTQWEYANQIIVFIRTYLVQCITTIKIFDIILARLINLLSQSVFAIQNKIKTIFLCSPSRK